MSLFRTLSALALYRPGERGRGRRIGRYVFECKRWRSVSRAICIRWTVVCSPTPSVGRSRPLFGFQLEPTNVRRLLLGVSSASSALRSRRNGWREGCRWPAGFSLFARWRSRRRSPPLLYALQEVCTMDAQLSCASVVSARCQQPPAFCQQSGEAVGFLYEALTRL